MRYPATLVMICLLVSPVQAADYTVHVPDQWVDEGIRWNGFYRGRSGEDVPKESKIEYFVNECLVDPTNSFAMDSAMFFFSKGKFKTWKEGGVSIDPVGEQIIVHVPDYLIIEVVGLERYQAFSDDQARAKFFLDEIVLSPINTWLLDQIIRAKTWGKIKSFEASGITVEVLHGKE